MTIMYSYLKFLAFYFFLFNSGTNVFTVSQYFSSAVKVKYCIQIT